MNPDERQDDSRDQQDVQRVEPRDDDGAGEVTAEQRPVQPGADQWHAEGDRGEGGAQAGAREQVVGQGVAEVALEHRQDQQQRADHPVGLARLAERAGEEHPGQVDHDRRREEQRGPVVDLADEQPAADLEGDVEGGLIRPGHLNAVERLVHPVVGDLGHRRVEEQREVHTGQQQHDEAVQRDLAKQERPVGREDLVQLSTHRRGGVVTRVDRVALRRDDGARFRTHVACAPRATRGLRQACSRSVARNLSIAMVTGPSQL